MLGTSQACDSSFRKWIFAEQTASSLIRSHYETQHTFKAALLKVQFVETYMSPHYLAEIIIFLSVSAGEQLKALRLALYEFLF